MDRNQAIANREQGFKEIRQNYEQKDRERKKEKKRMNCMNAPLRLLLLFWFGLFFCYVLQMLTQYQLSKNSCFKIQITITFIDKIACKMVNIILIGD